MRGRQSSGRGRCGRTGEAGTGADSQRGTEARCGLKRGAGAALDHTAGLRLRRVAAAVRCGDGGNNHDSVEEQGGAGTCAEVGKRKSYGWVACVLYYKGSDLLVRRRKNATETSQDRQREALSCRFSLLRSSSLLACGCFFLVLLCLRAFLVGDSLPRILSPLIASCPLDLLRLGGAGSGRRHLDKIIILMDKGGSGYRA